MDRDQFQEMATAGEVPPDVARLSTDDAEALLGRARTFERNARSAIQSLSRGFPWPTLFVFVGVLSALIIVSLLTVAGYLSFWAAIPTNGVLIYYIFTPLHEAVHGNIAGRNPRLAWLESVIGHASGFVLLAPYPGYRVLHLHHHANTNDPVEDPDYWVKSRTWLGQLIRCLVIQPVYILHLWKIARDPRTMRIFFWELAYVASYVVIVFAAWRFGFGKELTLLWILPGYIGVVLAPLMLDWPVHHPHTGRGRYADTAILLFPRRFRLIMDIAFSGHTYHLIHHLYPRVPFYRYAAAWRTLGKELMTLDPLVREFSF
jgi:beta-carotene hydroxylase